jgi:hypothetical protein
VADYMQQAPYIVGYWIDQAGRRDPSHSPAEHERLHVELAGHDVELIPLKLSQYGSIIDKTQAVWNEGIYTFKVGRPGNSALTLEVIDTRTGNRVGSAAFWAGEDGSLKMAMPKDLMADQAFAEAMVLPVMRDAEIAARQWRRDQELKRIASADQTRAKLAQNRVERGEPTLADIESAVELSGIDLTREADAELDL